MYIVFHQTNDVFKAEEKLTIKSIECEVVSTPVTDKAYCGVCIRTIDDEKLISNVLNNISYCIIKK